MAQRNNDVILSCRELRKSYVKGVPVLDGLNIEINGGRIVGLLGPNGCGKSTLIKLVLGILVPDSGEIEICGQHPSEKTNGIIAYLPERSYFGSGMTINDLIAYFCDFFPDFDAKAARKMLSDLLIDPASRLKTLSKGTKEKVQLIMVMARKARLYLLDEPIAGVDPAARDYILSTIIGTYNPDAAVVITTHLISDVERILDDFLFMGFGGKIIRSGRVDDVRDAEGKSLDELFREDFRC